MPRDKTVSIHFPIRGLDRSVPYSEQPPDTTPDCLNVIPLGNIEGRRRGGARPGVDRFFSDPIGGLTLGGGNPEDVRQTNPTDPVGAAPRAEIQSSTNAAPIVITMDIEHGLSVGDIVRIDNHATNTNANGTWVLSAVTALTFTLLGSTGNGAGQFGTWGTEIQGMATVTTIPGFAIHRFFDEFVPEQTWGSGAENGQFGKMWSAATFKTDGFPNYNHTGDESTKFPASYFPGGAICAYNGEVTGAILEKQKFFDDTALYRIDIEIASLLGEYESTHYVYIKLDDAAPDATQDGITVSIQSSGSGGSYTFTFGISGVAGGAGQTINGDTSATVTSGDTRGVMQIAVSQDGGAVSTYWRGVKVMGSTPTAPLSNLTGTRVGFGIDGESSGGRVLGGWMTEFVLLFLTTNNARELTTGLVTIAGGSLYYEQVPRRLSGIKPTVEASGGIATSTDATPIVISDIAHGLSNGDAITVFGHLTNIAANDDWIVANKTANTFELVGSVGSGGGAGSGGGWRKGGLSLASDRPLNMVERGGVIFIADNADPLALGNLLTGTATGTAVDDSDIADWTTQKINLKNHIFNIIDKDYTASSTEDVLLGSYGISTVAAGNLTLDRTTSGSAADAIGWRIDVAPKFFSPYDLSGSDTLGRLQLWKTRLYNAQDVTDRGVTLGDPAGHVPAGNHIIVRYRDRILLAGNPSHAWYMSRQGDPFDFDFGISSSDAGRAVAGTVSVAGLMGIALTAIIPYSDDTLLFASAASLWVMRGDPAADGELDNLSNEIGVVGQNAWCNTPEGGIVFLSRDGIYQMAPGAGSKPQSISREKIADELLEVTGIYSSLVYDVRHRGIWVSAAHKNHLWRRQMFISWPEGNFWPIEFLRSTTGYSDPKEPLVQLAYNDREGSSGVVLMGCRDGMIREVVPAAFGDDGTVFDSYVVIGPIPLGGTPGNEGLLNAIQGIMSYPGRITAKAGQDVDWEVRVADSAEELKIASAFITGSWVDGVNTLNRVRVRGRFASIKIIKGSSGNKRWSLERIEVQITMLGRARET